jgi:hypothetical protein
VAKRNSPAGTFDFISSALQPLLLTMLASGGEAYGEPSGEVKVTILLTQKPLKETQEPVWCT